MWENVLGVGGEVWKGCWGGGNGCWVGVGKRGGGVRGSVGRMVSRSRTPTPTPLHPTLRSTPPDPNPTTPTPLIPTPPTSTPPVSNPLTQTPPNCVFWPQHAFLLLLNSGLNARFVEYLEETKLEFFQT